MSSGSCIVPVICPVCRARLAVPVLELPGHTPSHEVDSAYLQRHFATHGSGDGEPLALAA